jgi:hypothetical protein
MSEYLNIYVENINNKINSYKSSDKNSPDFQKNKFELRTALFLMFDSLTKASDDSKKELFKSFEKYPEIFADIVSASDNPNCTCRGKVAAFFEKRPAETLEIYQDILTRIPQEDIFYQEVFKKIQQTMDRFNSQLNIDVNEPISLSGRVFKFTTDEEYTNFIIKINSKGHYYKGLQIIEKNNDIKVYFY